MARSERDQLCDAALQVGEAEPTLCEGWTVKDLVVHLVVRESSPAAVGVVVRPLAGLTDRVSRRLAERDFTVLVERVRSGPPRYSPFAVPRVDAMVNTMEYFVHHEDIRRARPAWTPRKLSDRDEDRLWRIVRVAGRGLVRASDVAVTIERTDTGERAVLKKGGSAVVVRGIPSEVSLFVYGRKQQADVELLGADDAVARLRGSSLGV
jgi:uncharacterized protein (TIGR03085 family)